MTRKILIIDDEPNVGLILKILLAQAGYEVTVATSGKEGLEKAHNYYPDLIMLDIMMSDISGWQVCRHLRETSNVPIIMLTVLDGEENIVKGLSLGADDYIVKPWSKQGLLARIQAVLRRAYMSPTTTGQHTSSRGDLVLDPLRREITLGDGKIHLTPIEFRLLTYLVRRSGRVVPHSELIAQVWGGECDQDIDCLRWHIFNLRRKIEKDPKHPHRIQVKHGIGYCFTDQSASDHSSTSVHRSAS